MKKLLLPLLALSFFFAEAQVNMPQPSPAQTIIQSFGLGQIELTYSRPSIKGRTLFEQNSDLAPLGKLWRTGANAATKLKFTDEVVINGKKIAAGAYALYTIPGKNEWEVIINKGADNEGASNYKESEDVVRIKVPVVKVQGKPVETFTMQFADIKPESCELYLRWGNSLVAIPIATEIKDRLRAQIEAALKTDKAPYAQAANFYFDWDKNYDKALANVTKATEENNNAFWLYLLKAKIEKAKGDKIGAIASAEKCVNLAATAKNDEYVKMGNELIKSLK